VRKASAYASAFRLLVYPVDRSTRRPSNTNRIDHVFPLRCLYNFMSVGGAVRDTQGNFVIRMMAACWLHGTILSTAFVLSCGQALCQQHGTSSGRDQRFLIGHALGLSSTEPISNTISHQWCMSAPGHTEIRVQYWSRALQLAPRKHLDCVRLLHTFIEDFTNN
jgi:hypothetical protein